MKTRLLPRIITAGLVGAGCLCTAPIMAQTVAFTISAYRIDGPQLLPAEESARVLAPFTGEQRSLRDVTRAADALRKAYIAAGYPIVQVFTPEQAVSEGTVALRVVVGRITKVSIKGNQAFGIDNIRASLPVLREGTYPKAADIVANLALANENPAKQATVDLKSGNAAGEIDAQVEVRESPIAKYSFSLDNSGSLATGYDRVGLGFQYANLFNRDQILNLQYAFSTNYPRKVNNVIASWHAPLYDSGLSLDVIGSYAANQTNTTTAAGPLVFTGSGTYGALRLNQPLAALGEYTHRLIYGFDYKDFGNECAISEISLQNCGSISALPLSLAYAGQYAGQTLKAGGSLGYYSNIAGGPHGNQLRYTAARADAGRHWQAWRLSAYAGYALPADWRLQINGNAQWTPNKLIPSEQIGLGGAASVRGYDERTVAGDYGLVGNLELYTPDLAKALGANDWALRLLAFYDVGRIWRRLPTEQQASCAETSPLMCSTNHLSSFGAGLRAYYKTALQVKFDVAWAQAPWNDSSGIANSADRHSLLRRLSLNTSEGTTRRSGQASAHFSIAYSF